MKDHRFTHAPRHMVVRYNSDFFVNLEVCAGHERESIVTDDSFFMIYIESTNSIPYCEQKDQARKG